MFSSHVKIFIPRSRKGTKGHAGRPASDLKTVAGGAVLSFHNICYRVKVKSGFLFRKQTVEKEILSNINGIMRPGLNAIMGPTGAGKSVLLDVLAGRKDPQGLSGAVLINGEPPPPNFRCCSGYAPQGDIMMGMLTVIENLEFSAALRLPTTMTNHEKHARVNKVLEELGLDKVKDCKVGTELIHGVSAAERKRTSIGMELVIDPSILFLHKPTNGLDSNTAHAVLLLLKRISKQGRTIIFSIHQPQNPIFQLFDSLTVLARGTVMFHGPAQDASEHFGRAGYSESPYDNPVDFFLSVIKGDSLAVKLNTEVEDGEASKTEELGKGEKSVTEKLAEFYATSSVYRDMKAELDQLFGGREKRRSPALQEVTRVTSFCHQLGWVTWRSFKDLLGHRPVTLVQIIIPIIVGLVVGAIFLRLKSACTEVNNRVSLFLLLTIYECFNYLWARDLFEAELKLFKHEYMSGYYGLSSYFLGKLLSGLLLRRILPSVTLTSVLYIMLGLKPSADAFFTTVFTVLLVSCSTHLVVMAITARQLLVYIPGYIQDICFLFSLICYSGFVLNVRDMGTVLLWLQYISIPHYGFLALQHNDFSGQDFCAGINASELTDCPTMTICSGEEFLTIQGIDLSPWGLWKNHLILACIVTVSLTIVYLNLHFLKKHT